MAWSELGDKQKAALFMSRTVNVAKHVNVPEEYLNYLEALLKKYSSPN
jgi:hypothetical protein